MDQTTIPRQCSVRLDGLALSSTEAFVLAQIDGAATLEDVADATGVPLEKVIAIARRLEELGAIEPPKPGSRAGGRYAGGGQAREEQTRGPGSDDGRKLPRTRPASEAPRATSLSSRLAPVPRSAQPKPARPSQGKLRAAREMEGPPAKPRPPARPSKSLPRANPVPPRKPSTAALRKPSTAAMRKPSTAAMRRPSPAPARKPSTGAMRKPTRADRDAISRQAVEKARADQAIERASTATKAPVTEIPPSKRITLPDPDALGSSGPTVEAQTAKNVAPPPPAPKNPGAPAPAPQAPKNVAPAQAPEPPPTNIILPIEPDSLKKISLVELEAPKKISLVDPQNPNKISVLGPQPAKRISLADPQPAPKIAIADPQSTKTELHASARRLVAAAKSASLLEEARQALQANDAIAAANHYRLALQYAEDPASRTEAQAGLDEASALMADTYLAKARAEEKESRWTGAATWYEKARDRRPDDAAICERLANALRLEGQDFPRATKVAELAVSRAPRSAACRRTLGRIYADGGLREKAIEQFEKVIEIEPADPVAGEALKILRKRR